MSGQKKNKNQLVAEILNLQVTTSVLHNIIDVLWVKDMEGHYVMLSESFAGRYGKAVDETIGKTDYDIFPQAVADEHTKNDYSIMVNEITQLFLEKEKLPDGTSRFCEVCRSPVYDFFGKPVGILGVSRDITERIRLEENLVYISEHDALTGLYNRRYFERLPDQLARQGKRNMGVLLCDVDGLKLINDTLGHQAGDKALIKVADLLKMAVEGCGIAARIGGDEFAAILPNIAARELEQLCAKLQAAVSEKGAGLGLLPLSVSTGFAVADLQTESFDRLFTRIDDAMQKEKLLRNQSHRSALAKTVREMLNARDFVTGEHSDRLQTITIKIARRAGFSPERINDLKLFAQFHDLGKIGISDKILFKPGALTDEEKAEMRRHSQIGFRIAQTIPEFAVIADWVLKHHEWWDGSGYPLGLAGENIPLECRILSIADSYDAMVSDRPYRKAMTAFQALEELQKYAGRQFDPKLIECFLEIF